MILRKNTEKEDHESIKRKDIINEVSTYMLKHYTNKDLCILYVQLKGPESALYYRGEGYISDVNTGVTIELPQICR